MDPKVKTIIEQQLRSQEERITRNLHFSIKLKFELLNPLETTNPQ
jgi:hypothetical protein